MSRTTSHLFTAAYALVMVTFFSSGCVVDDGYGPEGGVGFGADYYEPYGYDYGGWGPGYQVGPYHDDRNHGAYHSAGGHSWRAAPVSHSIPSLPSGGRFGGGSRSGGGGSRGGGRGNEAR